MMKEEFEQRIGEKVDAIFYQRVEIIYLYHPFIKDVGGKDQIAMLYQQGILMDLFPKAQHIKSLEEIIQVQEEYLREGVFSGNEEKTRGAEKSISNMYKLLEGLRAPNSLA